MVGRCLVCILLHPSGRVGHLQEQTCPYLVATVSDRCCATMAAQVGIPDSLIQTLGCWKPSPFIIQCVHLDTFSSDDFGISTFVLLTLLNVHDYFALAMVNTSCMLLYCTYSYIYWYACLVHYVAYLQCMESNELC